MKLVNVSSIPNGRYSVAFEAADLSDLIHLLAASGGTTITQTLARLETFMATAAQKLDELERAVDEFDAREQAEDAEHALTVAEVESLKAEISALQAQLEAGNLPPDQEARLDSLIARIKASNSIPDEVLPDEAPPGE